jgi:hypothetical protein
VLRFGNGSDFRIWYDGASGTYLRNYALAGNTYFQSEDNAGVNHAMLYLRGDTDAPYVQLYGDGSETFRTKAGGVVVTGQAEAPYIFINRIGNTASGINWYSSSYKAWSMYMTDPGASRGPNGDITAPSGTLVTSWALRNFIENASGYGWTFESGTATGNPTVVAEIRSSDGAASFGPLQGSTLAVNNTSSSSKNGLSLYGGIAHGTDPTYGIMFTGTSGSGTFGDVSGDWATYFTMNNSAGRGWIFRNQGDGVNVASISNRGYLTAYRLYTGDGNDGFFYSDQNGRTAFASGDFYIQTSVANYYNYATNQYIGNASGNNIYFRGNTLSGNSWSLTGGGAFTTGGTIDVNGGLNGINLTNSSILSSATSDWTGNPGANGKIQYHSNRWYIVADSSSNRIVQFRRDATDLSYIDNNGTLVGGGMWSSYNDGSGSGLDADLLDGLQASQLLRSDTQATSSGSLILANNWAQGTWNSQFVIQGSNPSWETRGNSSQPYGWLHHQDSSGNYTLYSIASYNQNNWTQRFTFNHGDQTFRNGGPSGNVYYHQGNDGSGSGLDADLLDGFQLSSIPYATDGNSRGSVNTATSAAGSAANAITRSCFFRDNNVDFAALGINIQHSTSNNYNFQFGVGSYSDASALRVRVKNNGTWGSSLVVWNNGNDGSGSGLDADLLDGYDSASYLNKNAASYYQVNTWLQFNGGSSPYGLYFPSSGAGTHLYPNGSTFSSFLIEGNKGGYWGFSADTGVGRVNAMWRDSVSGFYNETHGWHFYWDSGTLWCGKGTYGGTNAKVWDASNDGAGSGLDADLLDGAQGSSYMRKDTSQTLSAEITAQGDFVGSGDGHRDHGVYGNYNSYRIHHMWGMGTAYRINANGTDFGNLYGFAYTYSNRVYTSNPMAGGHQIVWCQAGSPAAALGNSIWTSGNVTAYSDIRVKTNLEVIPDALNKVRRLNGYTFDRTDVKYDEEGNPTIPVRQTGVVAQEVLEVLPEAVTGSEESHYNVAYGNMVGLLIEAIKELKAEVDDLKAQLEEVK